MTETKPKEASIEDVNAMLDRYKDELISDTIGMGVSPIAFCEIRDAGMRWMQPNPKRLPKFYYTNTEDRRA